MTNMHSIKADNVIISHDVLISPLSGMEISSVSYQSFCFSHSLIQIKTVHPINLLFNNLKLEIGHYLFDTISLKF